MRTIGALLLIAVLTSCGGRAPNPKVQQSWAKDHGVPATLEQKAVVVIGTQAAHRAFIGRRTGPTSLVFKRRDAGAAQPWLITSKREETQVHVIDAGQYGFESAGAFRGHNDVQTPSFRAWTDGKPTIFGFTVAPGEVVYLGHVVFAPPTDKAYSWALAIEDRSDDARAALAAHLPEAKVRETLETRLIKAPSAIW